ncbi:HAD family phosphatase [Cyclobacteriaceae bacterium]|nr:HAD family phosphatase [Cyclobacteriaceae bacterium]
MNFKNIKNIIFDLGGVVIDIDFELTFKAFATLGNKSLDETKKIMTDLNIWDSYERGEITDQEFINIMRKAMGFSQTDEEIIMAWNALLLELPKERVELIKRLNKSYQTFVLSNTSNLHIQGLNKILKQSSGYDKLHDVMNNTIYFSYEIKRRKPDLDIYEYVLKESNLKAEETVFLDDNLDNILAARKVGIEAIHVEVPETILHYLKDA